MVDIHDPKNWKYVSPKEEGFHEVVNASNSILKVLSLYRLNLKKGNSYVLLNSSLELNGVVIEGKVKIKNAEDFIGLNAFDSFYLPANEKLTIKAEENMSIYLAGAPYEGIGKFYARKYNVDQPMSDINQIHGIPPFERKVFFTVNLNAEASRLIAGITVGEPGMWTSWPPHHHEKYLEEAYCFFNIPENKHVFHFSYTKPGHIDAVHSVTTGDITIIPKGFHPTVAIPGVRSCYFWIMAATSKENRRVDMAEVDRQYGL